MCRALSARPAFPNTEKKLVYVGAVNFSFSFIQPNSCTTQSNKQIYKVLELKETLKPLLVVGQ